MRKDFEDKSFIEIRIGSPGKIAVVLGARKKNNSLEIEVNACEVTIAEFADMIHNLGVELPKQIKQIVKNDIE